MVTKFGKCGDLEVPWSGLDFGVQNVKGLGHMAQSICYCYSVITLY